MPAQEGAIAVCNALNAVLKQRLEDKVMELIDLPPGTTDLKILDYLRIAQENRFSDLSYLLKEMVFELGREQIESQKARMQQERSHKERDLEDYLSQGTNLERIEKGLCYLTRQKPIEAGILDILARDNAKKDVALELKMENYIVEDVSVQLKKYMSELKETRFIFVAPEIKPGLYYALKEEHDKSMVSFFEVTQTGKHYDFRRIDGTNLPEAKHKHLKFRQKVNEPAEETSIVKVVRAVKPKAVVVRHSKHEHELRDHPVYYQIMFITNPELQDREKYLNPMMIVSPEQKRHLEELAMPSCVRDLLLHFEKEESESEKMVEEVNAAFAGQYAGTKLGGRDRKNFRRELERMRDFQRLTVAKIKRAYDSLQNYSADMSQQLNVIEHHCKRFAEVKYIFYDDSHKEFIKQVCKFEKELESRPEDAKQFRSIRYEGLFLAAKLTEELCILKKRRTQKLMEIDEVLAATYLRFNPRIDDILNQMLECTGNACHHADNFIFNTNQTINIYNFVKRDAELYKSILSVMHVKEREPEKARHSQTEENMHTHQYLCSELIKSIATSHNLGFTEDMHARIRNFADDAVFRYALPQNMLSALYASFDKFDLPKYAANKNTRPSEKKIRNFFDDITTAHISKGRVPTADELMALYHNA